MNSHQEQFSDAAIRRFLLGQLREEDRASFERALFCEAALEQRTQRGEFAIADDYALRKLRGKDLTAFVEKFPLSAARRTQIEVSRALSERLVPATEIQRETWLTLKHPAWKPGFAMIILIMLFATIWLATKEPLIVRRFVPHRNRPAAVTTPTPGIAHHAERTSDPAAHREDSAAPPSHEAATSAIVLDSTTTAENAPMVTLASVTDGKLRVQLMLSESAHSTYTGQLTNAGGDVFYNDANISAAADADRVDFDIPMECLAAGDFQIKLTRASDGKQVIYFLRMR